MSWPGLFHLRSLALPWVAAVLAALAAPLHAEQGAMRPAPTASAYQQRAVARYGPFQVVDSQTAILVGVTDEASPAQFSAMLQAFPKISTLALIECPGTYDDRANLRLGRMIRAAGLAIHVPAGGSVRSGAVELVFAGTSLEIDDGAEFAVHAWADEDGLEASDYAADAEENSKYLAYYHDMGLPDQRAEAFYAMTNSVPFEQARWFGASEMRRWLAPEKDMADIPQPAEGQQALAHLDFAPVLH
jgi:hypothetical protein